MASHRSALLWASISIAIFLRGMAKGQQGPSVPMVYCATVNTAEMHPLTYQYQSDGRCKENCTTLDYALAIVHNYDCWCSNLIPNRADWKPLEECQMPCPGFPSDYCGGDGLFGYMEVPPNKPTGTAPARFGLSTTLEPTTTSEVPDTVTVTPPSSSPSSSSFSSSSLSSPDGRPSPFIQTVTVGGTVRTVTATPDSTASSDPALVATQTPGLQSGAIAGIIVGVIAGLAVLAAFIWLLFMKRRRQNGEDAPGYGSPMRGGGSPGVLATPPTGEISGGGLVGADPQAKRRSHLMPVDPRLDPFAKGIYSADPNRSRESFTSLQDNQDYSRRVHDPPRVLRAVNPDPDDD